MNKSRSSIIEVVKSPLGFFALSLLIVEGFLGITLTFSEGLTSSAKFWGMMIGALLFTVVFLIVTLLVWKKPKNLMYGAPEHLEEAKIDAEREPRLVIPERAKKDALSTFMKFYTGDKRYAS